MDSRGSAGLLWIAGKSARLLWIAVESDGLLLWIVVESVCLLWIGGAAGGCYGLVGERVAAMDSWREHRDRII